MIFRDSISHASLAESIVSTLALRISFGSWGAWAQSPQNILVVRNVKLLYWFRFLLQDKQTNKQTYKYLFTSFRSKRYLFRWNTNLDSLNFGQIEGHLYLMSNKSSITCSCEIWFTSLPMLVVFNSDATWMVACDDITIRNEYFPIRIWSEVGLGIESRCDLEWGWQRSIKKFNS